MKMNYDGYSLDDLLRYYSLWLQQIEKAKDDELKNAYRADRDYVKKLIIKKIKEDKNYGIYY